MASLSCNTAPGVTFASLDDLKQHYKSDWHRYNLKRKAANLPVLSKDLFDQLVARTTAAQVEKDAKEKVKDDKFARREVQSQASHQGVSFKEAQAMRLKATKEDEAMDESDDEDEEDDDSEGEWEEMSGDEAEAVLAETEQRVAAMDSFQWNATRSLFDSHSENTVQEALQYMGNKFGFFLPDPEYVSDMNGLLRYLAMKIELGHQCIMCDKELRDPAAVRKHMLDKGHCKLRYGMPGDEDAEEELEEYYNYPREMEEDTEGEDGQQLVVSGSGNAGAVALTTGGLELVVGRSKNGDGGHVLGARSMARYYKQRPRPIDDRDDILANSNAIRQRHMVNGYMSLQRITARKQADIHQKINKAEEKNRRTWLNQKLRENVNRNLPRNVPY